MSITINLPAATEQQLRAEAEATGKNISALVTEAIEARLAVANLRVKEILATVHADFQRSGMSDAELTRLLEESLVKTRIERRSKPGQGA